jgi:hypothetical protein
MTRRTDAIRIEPDHWEPGGDVLGLVFETGQNSTVVRLTMDDLIELGRVIRVRVSPQHLPQELLDIVDKAAGKQHSRSGPVAACLAEVLTRHAERLAEEHGPGCCCKNCPWGGDHG